MGGGGGGGGRYAANGNPTRPSTGGSPTTYIYTYMYNVYMYYIDVYSRNIIGNILQSDEIEEEIM